MTFEIQSNMSFDWKAAWDDLFQRLYAFAHEWGQILRDTMDVDRTYYFDFDMEYEVHAELGKLMVDIYPQGSEAWQAWLEEFGKGSEMALDNPYIGEYMTSDYWNPLRMDRTIVGRAKGDYLGIDGQQHTSSGEMAGLDLEQLALETGNEDYAPTPPTYFIRNAMQSNRQAIYKSLQDILADWMANLARFFTS